jgi:hypothetical protein
LWKSAYDDAIDPDQSGRAMMVLSRRVMESIKIALAFVIIYAISSAWLGTGRASQQPVEDVNVGIL